MARAILDEHEPGLVTKVDADDDGNLVLWHEKDVTELLVQNQRIKSVIGKGYDRRNLDAPRWVARLDGLVLAEAISSGLLSIDPGGEYAQVIDQKKFRRWLNDRDHSKFRVSEGKV